LPVLEKILDIAPTPARIMAFIDILFELASRNSRVATQPPPVETCGTFCAIGFWGSDLRIDALIETREPF
jgi:hypothetical protein